MAVWEGTDLGKDAAWIRWRLICECEERGAADGAKIKPTGGPAVFWPVEGEEKKFKR